MIKEAISDQFQQRRHWTVFPLIFLFCFVFERVQLKGQRANGKASKLTVFLDWFYKAWKEGLSSGLN